MFLSKLVLDSRSKAARRDLSSPYQMHASLCRAFVGSEQTPPRFLWRLESNQNRQLPQVLVQSLADPDWQKFASLEAFEGYLDEMPRSKPIPLEHLQPAQTLRFRLKANPTVTKQGKRHGLKEVEEQLEWLVRQGQKGGFSVLGAMVAGSERVKMYKHEKGSSIVVQSVLYEGHLKITDLETFKQILEAGLGHAKALGFGLLSIAK